MKSTRTTTTRIRRRAPRVTSGERVGHPLFRSLFEKRSRRKEGRRRKRLHRKGWLPASPVIACQLLQFRVIKLILGGRWTQGDGRWPSGFSFISRQFPRGILGYPFAARCVSASICGSRCRSTGQRVTLWSIIVCRPRVFMGRVLSFSRAGAYWYLELYLGVLYVVSLRCWARIFKFFLLYQIVLGFSKNLILSFS